VEAHEAQLERQIASIRKEVEKAAKGSDRMDEMMAQRMRELDISVGSEKALKVPEHTVVNSRAHVRHYAAKAGLGEAETDAVIKAIDPSFFRHMPKQSELNRINKELLVDEKWKMLLLAGVGAHAPHSAAVNPQGNTSYTNYVSEQMEKGSLAVCAVTKDFTYGANVPCTSVLIEEAFSSHHSANTLRQFIGRVARTGLASFGVAQFEDDAALHKLFMRNDNLEAEVMEATSKAQIERSKAPAA